MNKYEVLGIVNEGKRRKKSTLLFLVVNAYY